MRVEHKRRLKMNEKKKQAKQNIKLSIRSIQTKRKRRKQEEDKKVQEDQEYSEDGLTTNLLPDEDLEVLVDDSDGQQYPCTAADGSHEVRQHRQGADTQTAERSGGGDVTVQLVDHRGLTVAPHHHLVGGGVRGDGDG